MIHRNGIYSEWRDAKGAPPESCQLEAEGYAVARGLSAMFFGVGALDLLVYSAGALLLTCVAVIANLVPARRASRTNPMQSLREG